MSNRNSRCNSLEIRGSGSIESITNGAQKLGTNESVKSFRGTNASTSSIEKPLTSFGGSPSEGSSLKNVQAELIPNIQKRRARANSYSETLRNELHFFFMNPIQKWVAKRRFPYKFLTQVVKIILITFQLCLFAEVRYNHANYIWDNKVAFSHLFLRGWDPQREITTYPPALGPFAIYHADAFYESMDYAIRSYKNLSNAIGPYFYIENNGTISPVNLCLFFRNINITNYGNYPTNNFTPQKDCLQISHMGIKSDFSTENFLRDKNVSLSFTNLTKVELEFPLKSIDVQTTNMHCIRFNVSIIFDNRNMDGKMMVKLNSMSNHWRCDPHASADTQQDPHTMSVVNYLVIAICTISLSLCARSMYRAQLLKYKTIRYFRIVKGVELSNDARLEFWNFWYIMIIVNDVFIITGSILQEEIAQNKYTGKMWTSCSLCFGVGNMLVWFGVLRYLGFFKTYNVVILTLKIAFPKILRFLLCAVLIYSGFVFCGWLVLGPYHMKFRTLSTTSECLFALLNGDDMFATFTILETDSSLLWWFSRIYIYSFISLYIYVVLSLFISVIMDSYETIKGYYDNGFPTNDLHKFINEHSDDNLDDFEGDMYYNQGVWSLVKYFFYVVLFPCYNRR